MYCVMYIMFEFIIDRGRPEGPMPGLTPMGGVCPKTMVGGGDLKFFSKCIFLKVFFYYFSKKMYVLPLTFTGIACHIIFVISNVFRHLLIKIV